ncbi:hypothetical protein EJ05DRAFT_477505 [Pseudovirgaria hyperparasitica]|uniref:BHLH domain-containing protein n=1 Tax=Pseudovirgaria hyperparasitica TaxID=470096 RepID=A0A6A6W2U0_9PEZI|nr:uncharacterized protein EJ05DRAFT_477505 [Pseudovirgaria hyperparasitica]KAF2756334.1 hypothetical protein EJ05DRAFT_477505 [Pseudovirgaria hyperparasitica]
MAQQVPDHDFANFLDLGDLGDLEFSFDSNGAPIREPSQQLNELPDGMHMLHMGSDVHSTQTQIANVHQQHVQQFRPAQHSISQPDPSDGIYDMKYGLGMNLYTNSQSQFGYQADQQRFVSHSAIPPTPNSLEIHAGARYVQQYQPQQHAHQQHTDPQKQTPYQLRNDDAASLTPLVSPAVTPQEAAFRVQQDFTVPGAYFSPLTSPALEAQRKRHHVNQHTPGTSASSAATSPIDTDVDMLDHVTQDTARQVRYSTGNNRRNGPRSATSASKVRQSPIQRARRKSKPSSNITPKEIVMLKEAEAAQAGDLRRQRASGYGLDVPHPSQEASDASISPEPLTESLMGPPPRPASLTQSPNILGNNMSGHNHGVAPATPASLMRLQNAPEENSPNIQPNGRSAPGCPPILEDLNLPEAAQRPVVLRDPSHNGALTPRAMARKTPKLGPRMTPSAGAALSGRPSPSLSAMASPTTPITHSPGMGRKLDAKGRTSKKRNSTSSTLVSPALRPKISPSIKPLLPEGSQGMTDDQHALLLASKSNYQNILEGTHVPGVNYPEALSTNLTSKRTSHKIAEQGRRNRINTALLEMQSLLPSPVVSKNNSKSPGNDAKSTEEELETPEANSKSNSGSAAAQSSSKAATVEQAIDYIRTLQKERADVDKELEVLRQKVKLLESESRTVSDGSQGG